MSMMDSDLNNEGIMENVIDLGNFKDFRKAKARSRQYEQYLKSLEQSQLELEVNSLLDDVTEGKTDKNYFSRGQMILREIRSRAHNSVKRKIDQITDLRLL